MKKIIILTTFLFVCCILSHAQIRIVNSTTNFPVLNSPAFIDASSNNTVNQAANVNLGKGLVFPRTDLSLMTSLSTVFSGNPANFPNRFDGMVVFNTKEGGTAGVGFTEGELTRGFWYYDNPNGHLPSGNVGSGTWKPLGSGSGSSSSCFLIDCYSLGILEVTPGETVNISRSLSYTQGGGSTELTNGTILNTSNLPVNGLSVSVDGTQTLSTAGSLQIKITGTPVTIGHFFIPITISGAECSVFVISDYSTAGTIGTLDCSGTNGLMFTQGMYDDKSGYLWYSGKTGAPINLTGDQIYRSSSFA